MGGREGAVPPIHSLLYKKTFHPFGTGDLKRLVSH